MIVRRIGIAVVALMLLAACDKVEQIGSIMADERLTLVFAPGAEIAIDGKPVPIQGFDDCPEANPAMVKIFGVESTAGKHTCVVIKPRTTNVSVLLALPQGGVKEQWAVSEDFGKIRLQRPDGSQVVGWKHVDKMAAPVPATVAQAPGMKRAHKVEPLDVKTLPGDKATMVAVLTYEDGTKAKCEYTMRWQMATLKDRAAVQFIPETERCVSIK